MITEDLGSQVDRGEPSRLVDHVHIMMGFVDRSCIVRIDYLVYSTCRQNFVRGDSVNPASVDVLGVLVNDIPSSVWACWIESAALTFSVHG